MTINEEAKYLKGLVEKHNIDEDGRLTEKHKPYSDIFEKQARYICEGVYSWGSIYARDTRLLFLKGILAMNGISFEEDED
ncbi:MAG: hypothetical protein OQK82_08365 [Candidatus Pacearchaeota archaeon]|nr:hypothetical protein [Candidatus Pacearchaeota archaeon]